MLRKNMIANLSRIKNFRKPKSFGDGATEYFDKEILRRTLIVFA